MTEGAIIVGHLNRIIEALTYAHLSMLIPQVAYKVTQAQWDSLIDEAMITGSLHATGPYFTDVRQATSMEYCGISIIKSKAP